MGGPRPGHAALAVRFPKGGQRFLRNMCVLPGRWVAQTPLEARADSSRGVNPCGWRWAARGRGEGLSGTTICNAALKHRSQLGVLAHWERIVRPVVAPPRDGMTLTLAGGSEGQQRPSQVPDVPSQTPDHTQREERQGCQVALHKRGFICKNRSPSGAMPCEHFLC